jgi:hypothetical protein
MLALHELTTSQLKQALGLREQIEELQSRLTAILGGSDDAPVRPATTKKKVGRPPGKRTMSPEGRAKIAAAQKARWSKTRETSVKTEKPTARAGKKKGLTAEGRARLSAAMKARWAARKTKASA